MPRSPASAVKRQREQAKRERAQRKADKRAQRKSDKAAGLDGGSSEGDDMIEEIDGTTDGE